MKPDTDKILTVTVPFIPPFDSDIQPPEWFVEKVKSFGKTMPDIKEFELHEIEGTRLVYFEDTNQWVDLGHNGIYRRRILAAASPPKDESTGHK